MLIDGSGGIYFLSEVTHLAWSNETELNADSSFVGHGLYLVRGWHKRRFGKLLNFCSKQFITTQLAQALIRLTKSIEQGAAAETISVSAESINLLPVSLERESREIQDLWVVTNQKTRIFSKMSARTSYLTSWNFVVVSTEAACLLIAFTS